MIAAAFILAGALWRFIDGLSRDSTGIPTGIRNMVTVALAVGAAWYGHPEPLAVWAGGWADLFPCRSTCDHYCRTVLNNTLSRYQPCETKNP